MKYFNESVFKNEGVLDIESVLIKNVFKFILQCFLKKN